LALKGTHPVKIKKLMGHKDLKTTDKYMHVAQARLEKVTDVLDGLFNGTGTKSEHFEQQLNSDDAK